MGARGVVEDVVGEKTVVGLADYGVLAFEVFATGGIGDHGASKGGHEGGADGEDDVAGGVEGGCY